MKVMAIFILALACALAATPLARSLARRIGFFDHPAPRKLHQAPMPLLGGVALYIAIVAALLIFNTHFIFELVSILVAATLMALIGLWDDLHHLSGPVKLLLQAAVAAGLYWSGVRVQLGWLPPALNLALSIGWMVGIMNAVNFLDNMDGLCGGICAVAATFFTLLALMNGQFLVAALSAAVTGACIGFLFFNRPPATIFMGDAGSLFLGLLLAVIGIKLRFPAHSNFVTWMIPPLVLAVPIFDTALVCVARLRRGVNPFTTAGKDHVSHRLVGRGRTAWEAVLTLYLAGCLGGLIAILVMQSSVSEGLQIGGLACLGAAWLIGRLVWVWEKKPAGN